MTISELATLLTFIAPFTGFAITLIPRLSNRACAAAVTFTLAITTASSLALFASALFTASSQSFTAPIMAVAGFSFSLRVDAVSSAFLLLSSTVAFLIALYCAWYSAVGTGFRALWPLFAATVGAVNLLMAANDALLLLLAWVGSGISSLLIAWRSERSGEVPTPLRSLAVIALSNIALLLGIVLILAASGPLSLSHLAENREWALSLATDGRLTAAVFALSFAALIRGAQLPFSDWFAGVRPESIPVLALVQSVVIVSSSAYLAVRLFPILYTACSAARVLTALLPPLSVIAVISGFTALFVGAAALVASSLDTILTYATASQLGYAFSALALGMLAGHIELGIFAAVMVAGSVALFVAALTLVVGNLYSAVGSLSIDDYGGLEGMMKLTAVSALFATCSLVGVFPFAGFWGKGFALSLSLAAAPALSAVLFASVVISVFFSSRLFLRVFMMETSEAVEKLISQEMPPQDPNVFGLFPPLALALSSLVLGGLAFALLPPFATAAAATVPGLKHLEYTVFVDPALLVFTVIVAIYGGGAAFFAYASAPGLVRKLARSPFASLCVGIASSYSLISASASAALRAATLLAELFETAFDLFFHALIPLVTEGVQAIFGAAEGAVDRFLHRSLPALVKWIISASTKTIRTLRGLFLKASKRAG